MARSESDYLLDLWGKNICPYCGRRIPEHSRVGTGRKSDGGFCSLDCYARYYQMEFGERARNLGKLAGEKPSPASEESPDERNR
jgi:hypothetical protein